MALLKPRRKPREYQTIRLFATLGFLTLLIVLLFKVVLFGPPVDDRSRLPAQNQIESHGP
jgi:hypothetical protein